MFISLKLSNRKEVGFIFPQGLQFNVNFSHQQVLANSHSEDDTPKNQDNQFNSFNYSEEQAKEHQFDTERSNKSDKL